MNIQYTVQVLQPVQKIPPVMPQIETVVFLMLENRSLDNVLGWLYNGKNNAPAVVYPAGSPAKFDGIVDDTNDYGGTTYRPGNGTAEYDDQACRVPFRDPHETLSRVQQQFYASDDGTMPSGYCWSTTPPMTGFAYDASSIAHSESQQVMGAYNQDQLPVLYGLAQQYAVSDRWFASVPSQTDPNRAFSVCGTSLGAEVNSDINSNTYAASNTIFNVLGSNGKTWGLYWWQSNRFLGAGEPILYNIPFTSAYFSQIKNAPNGTINTYSNFLQVVKSGGKLPNFCFLEPYWGGGLGDDDDFFGIQGNDYHPPTWIGPAEYQLNELYNALVACPQWSKMLFIITFDEGGGTYDHVPPTKCVSPDRHIGASGFKFDRLGIRVPTILVSPYIQPGTVFRAPTASPQYDFDHTSSIATLLKWAGVAPGSASLGDRVSVAPTFEGVLSDRVQQNIPPPTFTVPETYKQQGGGTGALNGGFTLNLTKDLDSHKLRLALEASSTSEELVNRLESLHSRTKRSQSS